jgi:hypothetical protein
MTWHQQFATSFSTFEMGNINDFAALYAEIDAGKWPVGTY